MKEKLKRLAPAISLSSFLLLADAVFVGVLVFTKLLTWQLITLCGVLSLLLTAAVFFLSRNTKKRVLVVISCVLSVLLLFVEAAGCYYAIIGSAALKKITKPQQEYSEIGIYVRNDDAAQSLADIDGYPIGILEMQDRAATDLALQEVAKAHQSPLETTGYESIERLMDGLLLSQKVDAIVLNESFFELLSEIEGHEGDGQKIRKIHTIRSAIETPEYIAPPENDNIFTVYISGIDCFGSIKRRSRSDVNILATVNAETGQVLLVSTPRDYFVPLSISNGPIR